MASPLLGYNNNVRHNGKLFHIQTEDSGTQHGHIHTHLFADGGRIICSKKTTYAQFIGTPRYPDAVKKLMQAQHKAMFIALRDGLFDADELAGAKEFAMRAIALEDEPKVESAQVDVDALERAAESYLSHSTAGGITSPGAVPAPRDPAPGPVAPATRPAQPTSTSSSSGRYQATQPVKPAAAPARVPPPAKGPRQDSLFGDGLLSEKSLDEVIMSYLAEDLDNKDS
jgi:hypothetical protein